MYICVFLLYAMETNQLLIIITSWIVKYVTDFVFTDRSLCLHADLFGMKMIIQRVLGMYDSPPSQARDSHMKRLGILGNGTYCKFLITLYPEMKYQW